MESNKKEQNHKSNNNNNQRQRHPKPENVHNRNGEEQKKGDKKPYKKERGPNAQQRDNNNEKLEEKITLFLNQVSLTRKLLQTNNIESAKLILQSFELSLVDFQKQIFNLTSSPGPVPVSVPVPVPVSELINVRQGQDRQPRYEKRNKDKFLFQSIMAVQNIFTSQISVPEPYKYDELSQYLLKFAEYLYKETVIAARDNLLHLFQQNLSIEVQFQMQQKMNIYSQVELMDIIFNNQGIICQVEAKSDQNPQLYPREQSLLIIVNQHKQFFIGKVCNISSERNQQSENNQRIKTFGLQLIFSKASNLFDEILYFKKQKQNGEKLFALELKQNCAQYFDLTLAYNYFWKHKFDYPFQDLIINKTQQQSNATVFIKDHTQYSLNHLARIPCYQYQSAIVNDIEQWPQLMKYPFSEKQRLSIKHIITRDFTIISGTEGKGKIQVLIAALETMLINWNIWNTKKQPILVIGESESAVSEVLQRLSEKTDKLFDEDIVHVKKSRNKGNQEGIVQKSFKKFHYVEARLQEDFTQTIKHLQQILEDKQNGQEVNKERERSIIQFQQMVNKIRQFNDSFAEKWIQDKKVVGVTLQDAMSNIQKLQNLNYSVLVIVEADQIQEASTIPFLIPSVKQLIMIGNYDQNINRKPTEILRGKDQQTFQQSLGKNLIDSGVKDYFNFNKVF